VVKRGQLEWARSLQALAQSGLAYDDVSVYDRERYEEVRRIAAEILAHPNGAEADAIERLLADETGHATPKLDTRGVVFREDEILLVLESRDELWTLPGGWVDVGESPSEAVTREILEESGYRTRARKLLALYDRDRQGHPPHPWHTWKAIFLCDLLDESQAELGAETSAARFFPRHELPQLSLSRITPRYIERAYDHRDNPQWATDFD
jgi:ADP-ribose pyrophosphatase YjhB (NUDIX family)